jgi:hypothetical protein
VPVLVQSALRASRQDRRWGAAGAADALAPAWVLGPPAELCFGPPVARAALGGHRAYAVPAREGAGEPGGDAAGGRRAQCFCERGDEFGCGGGLVVDDVVGAPAAVDGVEGRRNGVVNVYEREAAAAAADDPGDEYAVCRCHVPDGRRAAAARLCHESSDVRLLRATGVEMEAELPFGTLHAVLRPLLGHLGALPGAQRQALEGALALGDPKGVEPFAVGAGTLSLLGAAAEEGPLLCVVDDFHWVDDASRRALLFAARRLERESIAAVFGLRPDGPAAVELRGVEQIEVSPLADDACERILRQLTSDRLPAETAGLLIAAAADNPLTLLELADRLTPAQREGREAGLEPAASWVRSRRPARPESRLFAGFPGGAGPVYDPGIRLVSAHFGWDRAKERGLWPDLAASGIA